VIAGLLAATGSAETGQVLLDVLIILVAAKVAAELAERIRIPTVVGEIIAGVLIGPSVLNVVQSGDVLSTLAELGVILLLLEVGMHMDLGELRSVGKAAMGVAIVGVVLPFAGGFAIGPAFDLTSDQTLFLAAALTATSVGITARVFGELRALATGEARTVLGAAIADDVMGLIILTVVVRVVTGEGSVTVASIGAIIAIALLFLVVCTGLGVWLAPKLFALIDRHARSSATLFALALAFTLGIAQLASAAKLAPIIGAFVAGLSLGRSPVASRVQRELTPVGHLLIPVFFLQIGINVDVSAFADVSVVVLALAITAVAIVGKLAAGWAGRSARVDALTVGFGMIPRGEVGLIFASIGLGAAVFTQELYAAVLLMVLLTTLMTPPLLNWRIKQRSATYAHIEPEVMEEPSTGWLIAAEELTLAGVPNHDQLLNVALPTARSIAEGRRPSDELSAWISDASHDAHVTWTERTTASFLQLLEHGTDRSWRYLDATGALVRALPELANTIDRRKKDPSVLDPSRVVHLPTVERIRNLHRGVIDRPQEKEAVKATGRLSDLNSLLLAAFLLDVCDTDTHAAMAVLERLCLEPTLRDDAGRLVADSELLRSAAVRHDGLTSEAVLRLAVHLGDEPRADRLYVLSVAMGRLEAWEQQLLNELHELLLHTLHGQRSGTATAALVEQRRTAVRTHLADMADEQALDRVESAPLAYLLSQEPAAVARHLRLVARVASNGGIAANIHRLEPPVEAGALHNATAVAHIDIVARDAVGLLARSTGVLEELGLSIIDATVATWSDGCALQSFAVTSIAGHFPDEAEIALDLSAAMAAPLRSAGVADAVLRFDNTSSPWHTVAEVRATDRPGLLHAVAAAFAVSGVDVHAAQVSTSDELVFDVFEVTAVSGGKLTSEQQDFVSTTLRSGVAERDNKRFGKRRPLQRNNHKNTVGTQPKQSGPSAEISRS
jgi:Kef-type K+ transport system membrane component KefB